MKVPDELDRGIDCIVIGDTVLDDALSVPVEFAGKPVPVIISCLVLEG